MRATIIIVFFSIVPFICHAQCWTNFAVGTNHTLATLTDGTLWVWGWNCCGQLGDSTNINKASPIKLGNATVYTSYVKEVKF